MDACRSCSGHWRTHGPSDGYRNQPGSCDWLSASRACRGFRGFRRELAVRPGSSRAPSEDVGSALCSDGFFFACGYHRPRRQRLLPPAGQVRSPVGELLRKGAAVFVGEGCEPVCRLVRLGDGVRALSRQFAAAKRSTGKGCSNSSASPAALAARKVPTHWNTSCFRIEARRRFILAILSAESIVRA